MTLKQKLLTSLPFTEQAYDDEASAKAFCAQNNLTLIGMIQVDPAVTARIKAAESGLFAWLDKILPPDINPWGDFVFDPVAKVLDICMRGTGNLLEWDGDFLAILVACLYFNGRCHKGMQLVMDCIVMSLRSLIAKIPTDTTLIRIEGHSLGCSLATFTATLVRAAFPSTPIEIFLWEPPRVFDPGTAAAWNRDFPNTWAIKNHHDLVVSLPPGFEFGNIGQDVWVWGGWKWDDPKVAHHLETGPGPGVRELA